MAVAANKIYRIDDIEVDVSQSCLRRGGEEFHLRHKTFQVLLYLIEHHQRLVTKTELFDNLWKDTAVTDDALTRCIMDIRRALGDDTRQPRLLKTVPKSGFRFIVPIETVYSPLTSFIETEITTVEVEFTEEDNHHHINENPQSNALVAGAEIRQFMPEPAVKKRVDRRLILTAICLVVIIALSSVYVVRAIRPARRVSAEITLPKIPGKRSIVVMHFENQSGNPDIDWLREGLADMLITDLSRSNKIEVLSRQQLHQLLDDTGHASEEKIGLNDALDIGQKSHAELIVLGHFARLEQNIRVDVQLHDARTGNLLTTERLIVDKPGDILSQMDLLSLKFATYLGAVPDSNAARSLASAMTDNLDAYRYYSLALEQDQRYQLPDAIKLLEKAIVLDGQFAMAYARIGYIYAVRLHEYDKGKTYLEKAFQLSNRLTDKDRLYIAAWYANSRLDAPGAIETYRQLIAAYPTEIEAYQRLGGLLKAQEKPDEALAVINQGLTVDPLSRDSYNLQGHIYVRLGKYSEAAAAYQHYVTLAPEDPNALDSLGNCHQWFGHYDEAIAAYQRALELNPEAAVAIIHLGNTYFQQGRYRAAIDQFRRYIDVAWNDLSRARGYTALAYVYLKKGDLNQAKVSLKLASKYDRHSSVSALIEVALAENDLETAKRLVQPYSEKAFWDESSINGFLRFNYYEIGRVALKSGHHQEAIDNFKQLVNHTPLIWNIDSYEDSLANAYFESGQLDACIAEYERILKINPSYPLVHYHLGQAFEQKNQLDRAMAEYQQFLQIWKDADTDIPEVIAARSKLSRSS